jgi:hypothetical protein
MRDDRQIDGREHGLTRAVVDHLVPEHDLLAALRDDAQTQAVSGAHLDWRTRHLAHRTWRHVHVRLLQHLSADDWRKTNPRFTDENFQRNLRIVDEVKAVAAEAGATPAQIALAWLLAQGDDIAPIPGTKRVARVEENTAADRIELSAEQIERLNNLTPAAGERHDEGNVAVIDR